MGLHRIARRSRLGYFPSGLSRCVILPRQLFKSFATLLFIAFSVAGQPAAQDPQLQIVYVTRTGKKYHRSTCVHLRHGKISITLKEAKAKGYTPCRVCIPPQ
jgi:hypothetical protein